MLSDDEKKKLARKSLGGMFFNAIGKKNPSRRLRKEGEGMVNDTYRGRPDLAAKDYKKIRTGDLENLPTK